MEFLTMNKLRLVILFCPAILALIRIVTPLEALFLTVLISLPLIVVTAFFEKTPLPELSQQPLSERVFEDGEITVIAQRLAVEAVLGVLVRDLYVDRYSVQSWIETATGREKKAQRDKMIERSMYFASRMTDFNSAADLTKHL